MTKADWLILAGYVLAVTGCWLVFKPLAFLVAGLVCILLGRAAQPKEPS